MSRRLRLWVCARPAAWSKGSTGPRTFTGQHVRGAGGKQDYVAWHQPYLALTMDV